MSYKFFLGIGVLIIFAGGIYFLVLSPKNNGQAPVSNAIPANNAASMPAAADKTQAIVSSQRLATEAGFEILAAGGTAADAAVAVAAVLSVVEPWYSSVLGGGTWALYYDSKSGKAVSFDGVGPVGSLATVADYRRRADIAGMHQSNVPGSWDAWMIMLESCGRLDLGRVLDPAIKIAEEGYPAPQLMISWLDRLAPQVRLRPAAMAIYGREGGFVRTGGTVYQRDMASTFRNLAEAYEKEAGSGRSAAIRAARNYYYRGPIAQAIVDYSNGNGGYLTLEDFNSFEAQAVEPLSIKYDDAVTVYENPPNSQGIVMLLALNIIKEADLSSFDPDGADAIHLQVEALKLAFADRYKHIGDPERSDIPIKRLLSDEYAESQRQRIDMNRAMHWPIESGIAVDPAADHTTTFHIVDKEGNAAAVTTSLGAEFMVVPGTGIHMNNRMRMISLDAGDPNLLTPGYKVRHTSNPYMALKNGKPYILGGNTGVDTQPQGQLQQFVSVVEFGLSAQEAIDKPRFTSTAFPAGSYPYQVGNALQLENGFSSAAIAELKARGHNVDVGAGILGVANMLVIGEDGKSVQVGAESRGDKAYGRVIEAKK